MSDYYYSDSEGDNGAKSNWDDEKPPEKKEEVAQKPEPAVEHKIDTSLLREGTANNDEEDEEMAHKMRSPIAVIMGHVDTGKTKLLDKMRSTKVQDGEKGGITQQIGATFFPSSNLKRVTRMFNSKLNLQYETPGLLIIDTPGHEAFSNLRSRGSSLCDIAILVVDIMHGLEQQTIESLRMILDRKTPFVIALNKIDRLVDWKPKNNAAFMDTIKNQNEQTKQHYKKLLDEAVVQLASNGVNASAYNNMKLSNEEDSTIPIVPTSAITGEGIPDLLAIMQLLAERFMRNRLEKKTELQCAVLESKTEPGLGPVIDVILVNGVLRVKDTIVLSSISGEPIVTQIKVLLTPIPMKEMRVQCKWEKHNVIYASKGCRIAAPDLANAVAGAELFVARTHEEIEECKNKCTSDVQSILKKVNSSIDGLLVQCSTLGSLEAMLAHMQKYYPQHHVAYAGVGPLQKPHLQPMIEIAKRSPKVAVCLCFNIKIDNDVKRHAQNHNIVIFEAEIIYHLTDLYENYLKDLEFKEKEKARAKMVYPCEIEFLPDTLFRRSEPIVVGMKVLRGSLKKGTPLSTIGKDHKYIGYAEIIKLDNVDVNEANVGQEVSVQITDPNHKKATWEYKPTTKFFSNIDRPALNILKVYFREEMKKADLWGLISDIKTGLEIPDEDEN